MANEDAKTEPKRKTGRTKASPKKATAKAAAKKALPKKSSKKAPEFGAKSDFIRLQPKHMTAKAVVEAGKAMGLLFSDGLVYAVRGAKKAATGRASGTPKKTATKGNSPARREAAAKGDALAAQLRTAIAELGLSRSRAVFAEVEKAFAGA